MIGRLAVAATLAAAPGLAAQAPTTPQIGPDDATMTSWVTKVLDESPSPSPDGKSLLFQSNRNGTKTDFWVSDSDGNKPRLLLSDAEDIVAPVYSPDGKQIAYAGHVNGETDIFVINADGSDKRRLTNWKGSDGHPHWSSDGTRIYFNSDRATPDPTRGWGEREHEVYVMDADGGNVRQLTHCRSICTYPSPSPDGKWLVYRKIDNTPGRQWSQAPAKRNSEVYVSRLDGSEPRNITNDPAFDGYGVWSPDSRWIVFASNRDGIPNVGHVFAVRPDGTGLRRLTSGAWSYIQPAVAPDGKSVFVVRNISTDDWVIGLISRVPFE